MIYGLRTPTFQVAVYKGRYENKDVAIKMYKPLTNNANMDKVVTEAKCYQHLSSLINKDNCFIGYYGTYRQGNDQYLVMEYYETSLEDELQKRSVKTNKNMSQ